MPSARNPGGAPRQSAPDDRGGAPGGPWTAYRRAGDSNGLAFADQAERHGQRINHVLDCILVNCPVLFIERGQTVLTQVIVPRTTRPKGHCDALLCLPTRSIKTLGSSARRPPLRRIH